MRTSVILLLRRARRDSSVLFAQLPPTPRAPALGPGWAGLAAREQLSLSLSRSFQQTGKAPAKMPNNR